MVLRFALSFLSVLTLFSNTNVVHSIKSLFMLQEMAAKSSAFWSALQHPCMDGISPVFFHNHTWPVGVL